jgi:hypothetical protein
VRTRDAQDVELEAIGQRALGGPGSSSADDAAVDEDDPLHLAILPSANAVTKSG